MLISFPKLNKLMADTPSVPFHADSKHGSIQSSNSVTSDIFTVFPDCMIMWDEKDAVGESTPSSVNGPLSKKNQTTPSAIDPGASTSTGSDHQADNAQKAVQYHIHYHPLNNHRLLIAFLAGGAIALMMGFVYFKSQVSPSPGSVSEAGQTQSLSKSATM